MAAGAAFTFPNDKLDEFAAASLAAQTVPSGQDPNDLMSQILSVLLQMNQRQGQVEQSTKLILVNPFSSVPYKDAHLKTTHPVNFLMISSQLGRANIYFDGNSNGFTPPDIQVAAAANPVFLPVPYKDAPVDFRIGASDAASVGNGTAIYYGTIYAMYIRRG